MLSSIIMIQDLLIEAQRPPSSPVHVVGVVRCPQTVKVANYMVRDLAQGTITAELLQPDELVSGLMAQVCTSCCPHFTCFCLCLLLLLWAASASRLNYCRMLVWNASMPDDVYSITHGGQCTLLTEWHFGTMLAHCAGQDARLNGTRVHTICNHSSWTLAL